MRIDFRREDRFAEFLSPLRNYEPERQIVEHRYDPLTKHSTIITAGRFQYIKKLFESDPQEVSEIIEKTRNGCPFCPDQLERSTPRFPPNVVEEGKIMVSDTTLFPSLFAHMDYNAIAVLSKEHYLSLSELAPEKIYNGFRAGLTYFKKLSKAYNKTFYASFIENYFPLSGSTIIHPHMQAIVSDLPIGLLDELLQKSLEYFVREGSNFWEDFVGIEENSKRILGNIKDVVWLTPFAPASTYEVWAISQKYSSFLDIEEKVLEGFAEGIAKVLSFYQDEKLSCFNLVLYSGPLGIKSDDYFRIGLRIMGRSGYKFPYVSDLWGLQTLMLEGESYDTPENMAQKLKKYF